MFCCSIKNSTPLNYFLTLSRLFFGFWLFFAGLNKSGILTADPSDGFTSFIYGYLVPEFSKTFLPIFLVVLTGWFIAIGEIVLGILLMLGKRLRCVWTLTSILMFTLLFGLTVLRKDGLDSIWIYLIFSIINGALAGSNSCCEASSGCCETGCCDDDSCCSDSECCDDDTSCCDTKTSCCSEDTSCCDTKKTACCSDDKKETSCCDTEKESSECCKEKTSCCSINKK